jgi:Fis family transcriptional regulator
MSENKIKTTTLSETVETAVKSHMNQVSIENIKDLYDLVICEVEEPLFRSVMEETRGNQSKAAYALGVSRGTLRKKLKIYNLI